MALSILLAVLAAVLLAAAYFTIVRAKLEPEVKAEVVRTIPLLAVLLVVIGSSPLVAKEVREMIPRINGLKLAGVEISLSEARVTLAAFNRKLGEAKASNASYKPLSGTELARLSARTAAAYPLLRDKRVLWVDDRPENNINVVDLFDEMGIETVQVATSDRATAELESAVMPFNLVISDGGRPAEKGDKRLTNSNEVLQFVKSLRTRKDKIRTPVIILTADKVLVAKNKAKFFEVDAFITTDFMDFINRVMDVLEAQGISAQF